MRARPALRLAVGGVCLLRVRALSMLGGRRFERICVYTGRSLEGPAWSREHVVPVSVLKGCGARNARGDLHNLFIADRAVNAARRDYTLVEPWGNLRLRLGDDEWMVDARARVFAPPQRARGAVARACLYVRDTYGVDVESRAIDASALWRWADLPVSDYERRHHVVAQEQQGRCNPYVVGADDQASRGRKA
ncbi:hypothetical protein JKP88DRAFT_241317 [Tribonema minus]|uniref:Uncharacterized protein n=1 Tax=Tribonema minus TaxID=303371 RepID=A0A835Z6F6_9STRA|nr:hypothetical protein JKP88DRAFT_241317 [Tribonema minus]